MKKYFFIATAALAALASCSKVTTVEEPQKAITFEVANYASRTKANVKLNEEFTTFYTYAWFHQDNMDPQEFMKNEPIAFANNQWAPTTRPYYWPKVGYINFYSYAAKVDGEVTAATVSETELKIKNVVIKGDPAKDNIIVAAPALNKSANETVYTQISEVEKGVPTLFTHDLAQIQFKVSLDASAETLAEGYTWTVDIDANQTLMSIPNKGTMTVNYTADLDANNAAAPSWEVSAATESAASLKPAASVNMVASKGETVINDGFVAPFMVIPQTNSDLELTLNFKLTSKYGDDELVENLTRTVKIGAFSAGNTEWVYNTKYIYTLKIYPSGDVILFDPVITEYGDPTEGAIDVPQE